MHDADEPVVIHVHPSLMRPITYLGMERVLGIFLGGCVVLSAVAGTMIWQSSRSTSLFLAGVIVVVLTFAIPKVQEMTRTDPIMRRIAIRHVTHQRYYPAIAHLSSRGPLVRKGIVQP